jgi:hypothetical protein
MSTGVEDYVVYIRFNHGTAIEDIELPVATCASYEDARQAYRACRWLNDAVIRFEGETGGGD